MNQSDSTRAPEQDQVQNPAQNRALDEAPPAASAGSRQPALMQVPGLGAIALYMVFLAATVVLGVARRFFPPLYLVFPVFFFAAGMGLLMMLRWAWALTMAAVVLLLAVFVYQYTQHHAISFLLQGLLNAVFFLYLVRTEVRSRLR